MTSIIRCLMLLTLLWLITACQSDEPSSVVMPSMSATPDLTATATFEAVTTPRLNASTVTPVPLMPTVTPALPNKMGVHLLLDDGRNEWPVEDWPIHLDYARQAVGEWGYVTELVRLDDLDSSRWQRFMDLCAELQLIPLLRLATTFDLQAGWWNAPTPDPPQDWGGNGATAGGSYGTVATQYAAFVAALAWPTDQHYVIVGNEPNHGNEWSGRPDPVAYARFLIDLSSAMHEADPNVYVLNAGFDAFTPHTGSQPFVDGMYNMDQESFMDGMVAAYPDVFSHIDVWASHSYPLGPFTEPPWQQVYGRDLINDATNPNHVKPPAGIYNRGINGYEWELFKLATYGVPTLPVMITETGWRHAESTNPAATDNGRPLPDMATVTQYFDLALHGNNGRYPDLPAEGWHPWLTDPKIMAITPFAFNGLPAEWGHTNWLMLDEQGNVLGTYPIFELLTEANRRIEQGLREIKAYE